MEESAALFERMKIAAVEMNRQNDFGGLHVFVADGNCEDEHVEYCLGQDLTEAERDFAERMLQDFTEEQRCGVWAFAQCSDLQGA